MLWDLTLVLIGLFSGFCYWTLGSVFYGMMSYDDNEDTSIWWAILWPFGFILLVAVVSGGLLCSFISKYCNRSLFTCIILNKPMLFGKKIGDWLDKNLPSM